MYSLTKATEILTKHYMLWNQEISDIVLKYNTHKLRHSLWVLETGRNLIIKINEKNKINEETVKKAEIIFLLHDIGRFYQNNKINILKNSDFEHGDKWYNILKNEGFDDSICLAIKYHNKYNLDWLFQENGFKKMWLESQTQTILLSKLIRDADKLQNMIYTIFNISHFLKIDIYSQWLKREDISQINIIDIQNKKQIDRKNIFTFWDYLLSSLCWVFDINFQESIDMLNYYWYFEKILKEFWKIDEVSWRSLDVIKENLLNYKIN